MDILFVLPLTGWAPLRSFPQIWWTLWGQWLFRSLITFSCCPEQSKSCWWTKWCSGWSVVRRLQISMKEKKVENQETKKGQNLELQTCQSRKRKNVRLAFWLSWVCCGSSAGDVHRPVHRGGVPFAGHYGSVCGGWGFHPAGPQLLPEEPPFPPRPLLQQQ